MTQTEVGQKILLVGETRICQQVAYVLDFQNYDLVEKLTAENVELYRDHQIYICEFKRKSRELVARELTKTIKGIQYLDDICRTLDKEHAANRRRHKREARQCQIEIKRHQSLGGRIKQYFINLRYGFGPMFLYRIFFFRLIRAVKRYQYEKVKHQLIYLRVLKPSELLLYVLHAKPNPNIQCNALETGMNVGHLGEIRGCCSVRVPFGNLRYDGELDEIYHSKYARIIKLSSLNGSYCLCDLSRWCLGYCHGKTVIPDKALVTAKYPQSITLAFDRSCNLCCKSCRNHRYVISDDARKGAEIIVKKLINSEYLEQTQKLHMSGMGEVFYSPYYRKLLITDVKRKDMAVFSNGTLFNEENWSLLEGKYQTIEVIISVDAATATTYQKLRGGDFAVLTQNLKMLSDLRRQGKISRFQLNFVVQRDNFREMPAFVELGHSVKADNIQFTHMYNFGNLTQKEYNERSLIIDDEYFDQELWNVLQDPIFEDPIVNLHDLQRFIDASRTRYQ